LVTPNSKTSSDQTNGKKCALNQLLNHFCGITPYHNIRWKIFGHHSPCSYYRSLPDGHSRANHRRPTYPDIRTYHDWFAIFPHFTSFYRVEWVSGWVKLDIGSYKNPITERNFADIQNYTIEVEEHIISNFNI